MESLPYFLRFLQSENEKLKEDVKHLTTLYEGHKSSSDHYEKENEALKAELEKLKATKPEKAETSKADSKKEGGV
jgi:uncharacterized protein YaaN involved in tellurite resistance